MRHFTENAGFRLSTLPKTVAPVLIIRLMRTKGVFPIASALFEYTAMPKFCWCFKLLIGRHLNPYETWNDSKSLF
ncbi:hypothetical protein QE384_000404 [Acinetobacter baylyi]|nr:hypothetical protein [Acinetobacter baylyi]